MTPTSAWTADLGPNYRLVDAGDGWELQYRDPCMARWSAIAVRPTAVACLQAYLELQSDGTVAYEL